MLPLQPSTAINLDSNHFLGFGHRFLTINPLQYVKKLRSNIQSHLIRTNLHLSCRFMAMRAILPNMGLPFLIPASENPLSFSCLFAIIRVKSLMDQANYI
jgi:hypothetical protein